MTKVNPIQMQKFLKGMDYPAQKKDLVKQAEKNGADENVLSMLRELPERKFETPADVNEAVGEVNHSK